MATYYDLKQTGSQVDEALNKVPTIEQQVNTLTTEVAGKATTAYVDETIQVFAEEVTSALGVQMQHIINLSGVVDKKADTTYVDEAIATAINNAIITTINTEI